MGENGIVGNCEKENGLVGENGIVGEIGDCEKNMAVWDRWSIVKNNIELWDRWRIMGENIELWERTELGMSVGMKSMWDRELWGKRIVRENRIVGDTENCRREL